MLSLGLLGPDDRLAHEPRPTARRLHPFFSNLLPEGRLRQYIADKARIHPDREFPLLGLVGEDLPGAVIVRPHGHAVPVPDGGATPVLSPEAGPIKFSLAGVQLKFSAVREAKGGLTIPATGRGGAWIVKLPSETHDAVPETEFAMMTLAKAVGIEVPACDLVPLDRIAGLPEGLRQDRRAYVVKRFDRDGAARVHMEDFAQIFGIYPEEKYSRVSERNIAEVIWRETGETGLRQYIRRLVFNAAIGNGDMHAKNWSLIYRDGRTPALSPAYDLLTTLPYVGAGETLALTLVGTRDFSKFDEARLIRLAEKASLPPEIVRATARDAAQRTADAWSELRGRLDIPAAIIEAVDRHMARVPLMAPRPSAARRGGGGQA